MFYLITLVSTIWFNWVHPIHVTVCELQYSTERRTLEVSYKVFYDDLESSINKRYQVKLHLNTPQEHADADYYLAKYMETSLLLRHNGKVVKMDFVGKEYEQDALWIYYEVPQAPANANLLITNQVLMEEFDDQSNLLHFTKGEYKKSLRFTTDDKVLELTY